MSDRAVALVFTARFVDELLAGAWVVLTPTFRRAFGLSLVQVGLLEQVLAWVALAVEPPAAALVDVRSRRVLLAAGALAVGTAMLVMGAAPTYLVLLAGFALYGVGSGPLVSTADVVVVEVFAGAPDRAFSRATFVDTCGALAAPALVAAALAAGVPWRWVLAGAGLVALGYAAAAARTPLPGPPARSGPLAAHLFANATRIVRCGAARRALLPLLCFEVVEAAFLLRYVWLDESAGLSQTAVAAYAVAEQVGGLAALALLDRRLARGAGTGVLRVAVAALVPMPLVWVVAPAPLGTIAVGMALAAAQAVVWPLARTRALTAVPELAGAASAVASLFPALPVTLATAWLAEQASVGAAMAVTACGGAALMLGALGGRR